MECLPSVCLGEGHHDEGLGRIHIAHNKKNPQLSFNKRSGTGLSSNRISGREANKCTYLLFTGGKGHHDEGLGRIHIAQKNLHSLIESKLGPDYRATGYPVHELVCLPSVYWR